MIEGQNGVCILVLAGENLTLLFGLFFQKREKKEMFQINDSLNNSINNTYPFLTWRQYCVETQSELTIVDLLWFTPCIKWQISIKQHSTAASVGCSTGIPPPGTMLMALTLAVITSTHSAPCAQLSSYITDNIYRQWVNVCWEGAYVISQSYS